MTALSRPFRRITRRAGDGEPATVPVPQAPVVATEQSDIAIDIPESDPLFAYLQAAPGPVDIARLELASPALDALRAGGVALVVPLVTQGELIGTLNLGPRLSEQDYSSDDRRLLGTLAAQAAPAIRVAQLVREQAAEAAERERYEQELKVAQLIQQQFLPRELPKLPEWQIAAYYGPARVVGGDFYDFIDLGEGRIGVVVGDVTDKGVPAALVMARTHSILRAEAPRLIEPGLVLARANELLAPEMPARMFVTCLYGVLEPESGRFVFANAGHNLPYVRTTDGVIELRATGLPLGLMPGIAYEETEGFIGQGDAMLLYSDGMVEQHGPAREMFGFPRLRTAMEGDDAGSQLLDRLLEELGAFTGSGFEQEDDITLVTLRRSAGVTHEWSQARPEVELTRDEVAEDVVDQALLAFTIEGAIGNEREAMQRVADGGRAPGPRARAPRAPQDRGRRDRDERHRVRVAGRPGRSGRRARRRGRRDDPRPGHGSGPLGPRAGCRDAGPRRQARGPPEAPRMGPVPDPPHGGRHGRARRRWPADRDAHARP